MARRPPGRKALSAPGGTVVALEHRVVPDATLRVRIALVKPAPPEVVAASPLAMALRRRGRVSAEREPPSARDVVAELLGTAQVVIERRGVSFVRCEGLSARLVDGFLRQVARRLDVRRHAGARALATWGANARAATRARRVVSRFTHRSRARALAAWPPLASRPPRR